MMCRRMLSLALVVGACLAVVSCVPVQGSVPTATPTAASGGPGPTAAASPLAAGIDASRVPVPPPGSCHSVNGLPDATCTPGARNQNLTAAQLCARGFSTSSIRPPTSYTEPLKRRLMASYGLTGSPAAYELDHLDGLEDGGDPWAVANLWPQARRYTLPGHQPTGLPGPWAEDKDKVESLVHRMVCASPDHQDEYLQELASNWTQFLTEGALQASPPDSTATVEP